MGIKQLSVFVGNDAGRLMNMLGFLSHNEINIYTLSMADSAHFGIMRMVVSDTEP